MSNRIHIATIKEPHGIKGLVKMAVHAQDINLANGNLYIDEISDEKINIDIKNSHGKGLFLAQVKGSHDRNAAQELKGTKLFCLRSDLPNIKDDGYYHVDLIGINAISSGGDIVGKIIYVHNFGAGDLLEIKPENNPSFLLPFKNPYVVGVNIANGNIEINNWEDFA